MKGVWRFLGLAAVLACAGAAGAQGTAPAVSGKINFDVLTGAWSRPDGGYTVLIKSVAADGKLEATYFNPKPLPFEKARASRKGAAILVLLELRAGGYAGSVYSLAYDPASDQLKGTFYQAVAKQKFDIYFVRK